MYVGNVNLFQAPHVLKIKLRWRGAHSKKIVGANDSPLGVRGASRWWRVEHTKFRAQATTLSVFPACRDVGAGSVPEIWDTPLGVPGMVFAACRDAGAWSILEILGHKAEPRSSQCSWRVVTQAHGASLKFWGARDSPICDPGVS